MLAQDQHGTCWQGLFRGSVANNSCSCQALPSLAFKYLKITRAGESLDLPRCQEQPVCWHLCIPRQGALRAREVTEPGSVSGGRCSLRHQDIGKG